MVFWGLGWAGGVANIFVIYLGGSSIFFQRDWGGGGRQNFCLPHENVTGPPPPHLVINDSSLMKKRESAMKERNLKFDKIIKFSFSIANCRNRTMIFCSSTFCHPSSFCQEKQISSEICVEVEKKYIFCTFYPLKTDSNFQNCDECLTE